MYALKIDNLCKTYQQVNALKGISLSVKKGDFFALLGPNGAGKTTIIGIISSLIQKSSGKVRIFDIDVDQNFAKAKAHLGVVPQEFNFNPFEKVMDILIHQAGYYGVPRKTVLKRAAYYLKALGLWEKRNHISRALSGGMTRRLMIVRALIHHPKLLILDEPTAGVDIELRRSLWQFLRRINQEQGITIILTTHYLEEAESLCRNIAIINHGHIIENTSMARLLRQLDQETFVLDVKEPLPPTIDIKLYPVQRLNDYTLEVEVARHDNINSLFACLSQHNIQVVSMRNKTNRLEALFVRLTSQPEEQPHAT